MTIQEIEGLSFEELKAQRDAIAASLAKEKGDVLAARYLKALTDAKHRDERLGEQGKTITALQDGAEASRAQIAELLNQIKILKGAYTEIEAHVTQGREASRELAEANVVRIGELKQLYAQETQRSAQLKAEAIRNHRNMAEAAKLLNVALGDLAVEQANAVE